MLYDADAGEKVARAPSSRTSFPFCVLTLYDMRSTDRTQAASHIEQ
jgi:hypothetical protein